MSVARYKWQRRLRALWELAQKQYLETPLFGYLRGIESEHGVYACVDTLFEMVAVDAGKLLEGSTPQAKLLRKLVQLVESGDHEIVVADLEGDGPDAHELGVVSRDQNGKVKVLVNEDNNDLPKNIPTGRKGRRSHRRPALISNKLYKLLEKCVWLLIWPLERMSCASITVAASASCLKSSASLMTYFMMPLKLSDIFSAPS